MSRPIPRQVLREVQLVAGAKLRPSAGAFTLKMDSSNDILSIKNLNGRFCQSRSLVNNRFFLRVETRLYLKPTTILLSSL